MSTDELKIEHFDRVPTPNSRLVYKQTEGMGLDWNEVIHEVDEFVNSHPKLQKANGDHFLYFFSGFDSDDFHQGQVWVGREVIGFVDLQGQDDLYTYDLDAGEVLSLDLRGIETFEEVFLLESRARKRLSEHYSLANTWRVVFAVEHKQGSSKEIIMSLRLQFFENPSE